MYFTQQPATIEQELDMLVRDFEKNLEELLNRKPIEADLDPTKKIITRISLFKSMHNYCTDLKNEICKKNEQDKIPFQLFAELLDTPTFAKPYF